MLEREHPFRFGRDYFEKLFFLYNYILHLMKAFVKHKFNKKIKKFSLFKICDIIFTN